MAKIEIDGLTDKIVDGLCRRWKRPETVKVTKKVKEKVERPDPDTGEIVKSTVVREVQEDVPNPQTKEAFVKEYLIAFVTNEYRLVVREDDKTAAVVVADEKVKKEVSLK